MRILITNDDGINAPGLKVLEAIATELAGDGGEVWTVAPAFEQSGVGHCISYTHPTMLSEFGPRHFAAEGSPADCVLAAVYEVMREAPPDLVLSGVNRGGAMEAALQGLRAIALSQFYGPGNVNLDNPFEAAVAHGVQTVRSLLEHGLWDEDDYRLFYNVNFPPVPAAEVKGMRIVSQGWRKETNMGVLPTRSPSGRMFLWVKGGPQHHPTGPGTDVTANLDGYISVTPLRADLTAHETLETLRERLDT